MLCGRIEKHSAGDCGLEGQCTDDRAIKPAEILLWFHWVGWLVERTLAWISRDQSSSWQVVWSCPLWTSSFFSAAWGGLYGPISILASLVLWPPLTGASALSTMLGSQCQRTATVSRDLLDVLGGWVRWRNSWRSNSRQGNGFCGGTLKLKYTGHWVDRLIDRLRRGEGGLGRESERWSWRDGRGS